MSSLDQQEEWGFNDRFFTWKVAVMLRQSVLEAVRIGSRLPNQADDDAGVVVEEAGGPLFPAMQVPSLPYPL